MILKHFLHTQNAKLVLISNYTVCSSWQKP